MAREVAQVHVEGLTDFRRDLKRMEPALLKEFQKEHKEIAQDVASAAGRNAPRRSGRLAAGFKGTTSGSRGVVYSRVPYAPVHEWGGTISPRGTPITIRASAPVGKAIDAKQEQIVDRLGDAVERVADRTGWRG